MKKLWIYLVLLHILLFNLCNNVIKKCTPSLNSYFYKNNTLKYNKKRKKDNFQYPYYIYNIYDYVTKKKNLLKNCTHYFGKTCYHNNDIFKKKKYEQFRKFRSVRQKLFYFSNTICINGHNKYKLLKKRVKRKREENGKEHSTIPISLSFFDENEHHADTNKKNESFSNDRTTHDEEKKNLNEISTSYVDQRNEQNFSQAIKKTEEYIKGKEDNIIEEREIIKKKKVIENLKAQENAFSDKPLDLSMHDILKHIYKNGIYSSSKVLVNDICVWMKNAYVDFLKSKRDELKKEQNELAKQENEIASNVTKTINNSNEKKVVDSDISNDHDNEKKDCYNFIFDKNDDEQLGTYVESLKLYNKKNLSKYFFSFNRGNILKQLVTEGEDDILEEKEKKGINKKKNNIKKELAIQDKKNTIFDDHVQAILSNPMLKEDEDYYIDKKRYMKSNVTIEFNIYDTYNDKIILNNKNTNSTMIEFPLLYSHNIIQKCILTMKKLEKSIFYINNNLLFRNFISNDHPVTDHDKSVYDVILNENWIKIEMHLCNIYGTNEKWMGISPNSFSNEQTTKSFLSEYSLGSSNNLIGEQIASKKDPITMDENSKPNFEKEKNKINKPDDEINKKLDSIINDNKKMKSQNNSEISERQKEIIKRRKEHETRKELEIKSEFLLKKLENEMKYDPDHYMWKDLYPQLDEHHKKRTDKYFDDLKKEMSENKYSRGYTDNIKKKQTLKGYDLGEEIEGRTKYYFWKENIHSFSLYFLLHLYVKKTDILIDIDNHFFSLSIYGYTIIKDMFNHPINHSDSVWTLTDNDQTLIFAKNENNNNNKDFPVYEITYIDEQDIKKFIKKKYCLIYNIYKDNNHKYMWGSIFKTS
ncbi:conserved Plasmodium protein, unknown function [Plasmodium berghei]|uniref:CS domain-containing protein n=2 Tax=Plasmodium berghei TaxID=5821 RepID=A0A509AG13_PLABA|nr:conserved protein, unknown function [Plasmodium berghei ANKA]CXI03681.1 conserved Plasmodium protein, unknown function [Plasmodium berghei]SCL92134.1 conserved Plasmodium protein, unknown function [Plasmodium berghei]SCM15602.1 conserved Plasmodium protein, unknown function [Plasmodium berghei]SCM17394.1 conserved Plasmodium protein, unknown function [Plasmodium berghei]SCN22662.1 conserved Plasmodium protein, unknown function [Plasmodium berghei]|eukprot:XP_034420200.1 conserved protein, unknown function [Plasmodium berghei ANKA]